MGAETVWLSAGGQGCSRVGFQGAFGEGLFDQTRRRGHRIGRMQQQGTVHHALRWQGSRGRVLVSSGKPVASIWPENY